MEQSPLFGDGKLRRATRLSRDEMNLAEFPLTVLSTRAASGVKTLEFHDLIRGKNGDTINRSWIITAADKFGLPTASDDEVLLGLLKLSVDDNFRSRKVFFTRYELLRALRWTTEGRSYTRLQHALDRLSGVRIKATNAFYDNELKSHHTRNFGIIDEYELNDGRSTSPKPSFFTWSEIIFKSFQVGFIKKLDLDFYLGLQSAVSKRLYRFLDKHFWYKSRLNMPLFILAHEKIGISRNYQYASSLRQQLDPALEELREAGFISAFSYAGKGKDTTIEIMAAAGRGGQGVSLPAPSGNAAEGSSDLQARLSSVLVERGLRPVQVERLLKDRDQAALSRMEEIVRYVDSLVAAKSRLVSRSPTGFLYRAMEKPDQFTLPGEGNSRRGQTSFAFAKVDGGHQQAKQPPIESQALKAEYLTMRRRAIQQFQTEVEPDVLTRIRAEVERALVKLKGLISEARYQEAVDHGVGERLASLFAFPDFDEWVKSTARTSRLI